MSDERTQERASIPVFPRRQLLREGGMVLGGAVAAGHVSGAVAIAGTGSDRLSKWRALMQATPVSVEDYRPVALNSGEMSTLVAAIDRIIPGDELGPGASESGVHVFIDSALANDYAGVLPFYQLGLSSLNLAAPSGTFANEPAETQDAILAAFEAGAVVDVTDAGATPVSTPVRTAQQLGALQEIPQGFFQLMQEHTRQGMFGDPVHGGNRNFAGWDLINYPGIKLVWTAAEMEIDVDVEPEHVSVESFQEEE